MPILRRFLAVIKRNKAQRLTDSTSHDGFLDISPPSSPSSTYKPPVMIDSAFCASDISGTDTEWDDKLERTHQHGEQLLVEWNQSLDQLGSMMDKVTSPFQNTDRVALHQAQKFIESYLDDWKSHRHQKEGDADEKMQQANQQFSEQGDLKNCVIKIHQLERDLYHYRYTMNDQLTGLWDMKQKDQPVDTWKHHWQAYHQTSNQMESNFKTILEACSPKPDEYTCAVCLSLFTEPVTLQSCLHTFCKSCVQHIYCTCQLTQCDSACHDPANRPSNMVDEDDEVAPKKKLVRQLSGTYKPRYRHLPQQTPKKSQDKVTLQCDCPLSWSVPPAAQCPLCRHPFGPDDCRLAVGLDNLIRFYFPRHDRVRQKYDARERQLSRRRSLSAWRRLPSYHLPSVPLPPRRQSPAQTNNIPLTSMFSISNDLANLTRRSFIV